MDTDKIAMIFFFTIVIIFLAYFIIITQLQNYLSKSILKKFTSNKLHHSYVRYSQTKDNFASREGLGFPVKAEMYYDENLIIICPKRKGFFNGIFNISLPLIITTDKTNVERLARSQNVFVPDNIKITKWNDLIINYHDWLFSKVTYEITIEFFNKSDIVNLPIFNGLNLHKN
jgi:hypothetical protein